MGIFKNQKLSTGVLYFLILILTILTIYDTVMLCITYFQYPVSTIIYDKPQKNLDFPAVTICPQEIVSCQKLINAVEDLQKDDPKSEDFKHVTNLARVAGCCHMLKSCDLSDLLNCTCKDTGGPSFPGALPKIMSLNLGAPAEVVKEFYDSYSQLDEETKNNLSPSINFTVDKCVYLNDIDCLRYFKYTKMSRTTSPVCYTMNSGLIEKAASLSTNIRGTVAAIKLLLRQEENDYPSSGIVEASGYKVLVHDPNIVPQVVVEGFLVAPENLVDVAMNKHVNIFLKKPYPSKCMYSWDSTQYVPLHSIGGEPSRERYTQESCYEICKQEYIMRQCNCYERYFRINFKARKERRSKMQNYNMTQCPTESEYEEKKCDESSAKSEICDKGRCKSNIMKKKDFTKYCDCRIECRQVTYQQSISLTKYPSNNFKKEMHPLNDRIQYSAVVIYYSSLDLYVTEEEAVYPGLFTLFSNIGGSSGLYLGFSMLGIAEFISNQINKFTPAQVSNEVEKF